MYKIKFLSFLFSLIISVNFLAAQNLNDGKKFFYYERYNSAKDIFNKLVTANANNVDAVYWLGQTLIAQENVAGAKDLYQKTLTANANAPLLLVGMGHVELLEDKANDARNRFETAISLSKGKDVGVFNAIGRANIDAKSGDAAYAIEKLKMAADKDKKNVETELLLGDAYRKLTDGANSQISYQDALVIDPNNARASFMIGRIYQTQGFNQEPIYMKYYNDAITKDPNFAPAYEWLSEYYYHRDINKAKEYLDKYIAVSDADSKNCYYQASFLFASGKNQEAITKADECIASGGSNPYPNLYGVKALAYDKLGDSVNSKKFYEEYFAKQDTSKLGAPEYAAYAKVLLKFPGNDSIAGVYTDRAIMMDTLNSNKLDYINAISTSYMDAKNYASAGTWYTKLLNFKKDPGKLDYYNAGYNYYRGGSYPSADSVFALYSQKYPEDIFGWYLRARSSEGIDTTGVQGLAKPYYEKVISIADTTTDKEKVKQQLIVAYKYMVAYYYNVKNDKATALEYTDKILAIDPEDAQALANKKALSAPTAKPKTPAAKTATKPK